MIPSVEPANEDFFLGKGRTNSILRSAGSGVHISYYRIALFYDCSYFLLHSSSVVGKIRPISADLGVGQVVSKLI